jgi:hypothetical protein
MIYLIAIVLILAIIGLVLDEDSDNYGHHDNRPYSFYKTSQRKN